jgi:hypothetical protein
MPSRLSQKESLPVYTDRSKSVPIVYPTVSVPVPVAVVAAVMAELSGTSVKSWQAESMGADRVVLDRDCCSLWSNR